MAERTSHVLVRLRRPRGFSVIAAMVVGAAAGGQKCAGWDEFSADLASLLLSPREHPGGGGRGCRGTFGGYFGPSG